MSNQRCFMLRWRLVPLLMILVCAAVQPIASVVSPVIEVSPTIISACRSTLLDVSVAGFPVGDVTFQLISSESGNFSEQLILSIDSSISGLPAFRFPKFEFPTWPAAATSFVNLTVFFNSNSVRLVVPMFLKPCWQSAFSLLLCELEHYLRS